jgi:predicted permease
MIWVDLRYSARSLARTPALAATLLLTIALGIGSNAAVVGFVRGLVTRDLPLQGIESVVSLFARDARDAFGPVSYDSYLSLKGQSDAFELLGAARQSRTGIVLDGRSSVMSVAGLTSELADLLHLPLSDGILISHRVWQHELSGASAEGQEIQIDGARNRVAGVSPEWLEGLYVGSPVDIWMPLQDTSLQGLDRSSHIFWPFGRLRPDVSADEAQAAVNATRLAADMIAVRPYSGMTPDVSSGMARIGTLLSAAAGAVFFIACVNVATFLLSRSSARSHETSVRVALGASRGQLARQLLSDSVVVSVGGGAVGMLLALWTARVIPALLFAQDAEQLVFVPDFFGIVTVSAACAGVMIVCGLAPLFETRHDDPARVLRRESAGPSVAMRRLRTGLVVAQMTCCCLLVISAAILLSGFRTALQTNVGRQLEQSILATLEAQHRFSRPDLGLQYFHDAGQAVQSLPGILETAWSGTPPGTRPGWQSVRIEPPQLPMREVVMDVAAFTPRSLGDITLPPIAGRMFGGRDTARSCRVVIVNEEAASDFFDGDAVGRSIEDPAGQRVEIIGVVATDKTGRTSRARPTVYYYAGQTATPLDREGPEHFRIPVRPEPVRAVLGAHVVSVSYFDLMGLSSVAGRIFRSDAADDDCRVGVVNQAGSELYFGGHAVGGAVIDAAGRRTEIVGVVRSPLLRASQRNVEPAIYLPMAQDFLPLMTVIVKTREANDAMLASVRRTLDSVGGGRRPAVVTTLEDHLKRVALAPERIAMVLVGASAATALALGVLGLYGAMADAARRRRREFGVRLALGAQSWRLIRQVLEEGVRLAAAGAAAGLLGSLIVARWLERITPSAGPLPLWVWLAAPLALLGSVAIASVLPARLALATDPLTIMRDE